ncbi:MAG: DUF366 family protein [Pseudobdellovibrionaceae bacterium]
MKTQWLNQTVKYDGTQLRSLYAYLGHQLLGDSAVAWRGACDVSFEHMVDGEDLLDGSLIRGSDMVHFIIEIFDQSLMSGVLLQRLFAGIVRDVLWQLSPLANLEIQRQGDDLYWNQKKLSISIATQSPVSTMVHFAINVSPEGAPVAAAGLLDLQVDVKKFAEACLQQLQQEYQSMQEATWKVRPVP